MSATFGIAQGEREYNLFCIKASNHDFVFQNINIGLSGRDHNYD